MRVPRPWSLRPALVVAVVAAAPVVPVSASADEGPPTGTVRGAVVAASGAPLAGATVTVRRDGATVATARTGEDGTWQVDTLPVDGRPFNVEASAPEHETRMLGEEVGSGLPEPNAWVSGGGVSHLSTVVLRPLDAAIHGRVVGGDGAPLSGVAVGAVQASWSSRARQLRATTAADGRYSIRVPAGSYTLAADRPDLVTRWTGTTTPHERAVPQDAAWQAVAAGQSLQDVDFRLLARPARSCWGPGPDMHGRRTLAWLTGTTDRPEPSWPPADADLCAAPHAATQIVTQNDGPFTTGGQRMDLMEAYLAGGGDGPPIAMDRKGAAQTELETWISQNGDLIRAWMDSGFPPPAERPTGYPPGHPLHVPPVVATPPASRPSTVLRPTVALPAAVAVPRDRFVVRARCSATRPCAAGTFTATVARKAGPRVASGRSASTTRSRAVPLRLSARGRRLLRASRSLRVRIAWTARGATRATALGTLRLRSTPRR